MSDRTPSTPDFERELDDLFATEARLGRDHMVVRSGDLHRQLGAYPGPNHAMPTCCNVMYAAMASGDEVLRSPPKGKGANLFIRYRLPR